MKNNSKRHIKAIIVCSLIGMIVEIIHTKTIISPVLLVGALEGIFIIYLPYSIFSKKSEEN
jgi:hypothetical protein